MDSWTPTRVAEGELVRRGGERIMAEVDDEGGDDQLRAGGVLR